MSAGSDPEGVSRETPAGETTRRAREILETLAGGLVEDAVITERIAAETIRFEVSTSNTGILIGRDGRTLDALEYLVNRIALSDERGQAPTRFEVDVAQYRARRMETLENLARRSAATAIESCRPVELSPMSPRDRRIVHLALASEVGITSESEGEGDSRRIIIRPVGVR